MGDQTRLGIVRCTLELGYKKQKSVVKWTVHGELSEELMDLIWTPAYIDNINMLPVN